MKDIDPDTGMIETQFLKKFREKFSRAESDDVAWPRQSIDTPQEFANEFVAVFRSMFMLLEHDTVPPEGPPRSAKQLIKELVSETGWPDGESVPVAGPWEETRYRAFRRYEIACAINILMSLYNQQGPGGDSSGYPPKRPA